MTRFARAKGSKSSNEKAPSDSTPWEVMKEQLLQAKKDGEEAKKRLEAEKQRVENYENFLKEQKVQKRTATWCDFPEDRVDNKKPKFQDNEKNIVNKKKKKSVKSDEVKQNVQSQKLITDAPVENNETEHSPSQAKKTKPESNSDFEKCDNIKKMETPSKKNKKQKLMRQNNEKSSNGKSFERRKPINDNSYQIIIQGKEVQLVRYDGFPIMKKDAERLEELKKNMIKKGIPKSEIQRNMKLERRRAEKALARLKRDVCYNCRKGGHNLSDCPDLKSKIPGVDGVAEICFKCGSTEHKQFECKVQKDKEFRFATCFICNEQGHIARQCPDNPKGLYPNGGGCKLCGDVTHLKKDCPTTQDKREESAVKLQTLDAADNIEDINLPQNVATSKSEIKKPKKIKF